MPDRNAVNALGALGESAKPAVEKLQQIALGEETESSFDAKRALWNITGDPGYAIKIVEQILQRNQYALVEIHVEDRQQIWEALRFLNQKRDRAEAREILNRVEKGRFPNLRSFVRQLQESGSSS